MGRKIRLGPMWRPVLRILSKGRLLRGTPFDLFGYSRIRRIERVLIDDYVFLVEQLRHDLPQLGEEAAAAVAETAELVRGYEDVKLRGLHAYKARRAELGYPIGAPLPISSTIDAPIVADDRHVVIVGGGLAGWRTAQELRAAGFGGKLTILSDENYRPTTARRYTSGCSSPTSTASLTSSPATTVTRSRLASTFVAASRPQRGGHAPS